jgi:hypothetical protein
MSDPNDEMYLHTSRESLRRMIQDGWHDSAITTADRVIKAIDDRNALLVATQKNRILYEGTWMHLFVEDGVQVERECTIVLTEANSKTGTDDELLALTIVRDGKNRDATEEEFADVESSLDANDAFANPHVWELRHVDDLPAWAADQVVDRHAALA